MRHPQIRSRKVAGVTFVGSLLGSSLALLSLSCGHSAAGSCTEEPGDRCAAVDGGANVAMTSDAHLNDAPSGLIDTTTVAFTRIPLHSEFYSEGAASADVDQDGHLDVVTGPFWYAGPDFLTRYSIYPATPFDPKGYSDNFFAFPYDMNADGWPDVLFVGFPGTDASWYENPGRRDGVWIRHLVFNGVDDESPTFVDLTGDGRPELVCAHGGSLGWAAPDWNDPAAPWTFHALSPALGFATFTHGLGVGDVDGDGKMDVLEATGWWQQPAQLEGDPVWTRHPVPFGKGGGQMFAIDVNGDTRADVVTTWEAHGYGLSWFEQTGAPDAAPEFLEHPFAPKSPDDTTTSGPLIHEPHALARGDIDGDGHGDLVTGERFWGHVPAGDPSFDEPAAVYWMGWEGDGASAHFVAHLIDDATGIGTQIEVADLNGDGRTDVVVANKKGASIFLQRRSGAP